MKFFYLLTLYLVLLITTNSCKKEVDNEVQSKDTLFNEYFDNNDTKWAIGNYPEYKANIENGYYYIENKTDNSQLMVRNFSHLEVKNLLTIEVKLKYISGNLSTGFGIAWGMNEDISSYYVFNINQIQRFNIHYYNDHKYTSIKNWETKDSIHKNDNVLIIHLLDNQLYYIINNKIVHYTEFYNFFGNRIGLIVYGKTKVAFDYFKIYYKSIRIYDETGQFQGVEK